MEPSVDPSYLVISPTSKELYQEQAGRWRRIAIMLGVFGIISLSMNAWTMKEMQHTVDILEDATGPEAQAQQAEVVERLVIAVDCNVREAIQELVNQVADPKDNITVLCAEKDDANE